MVVNFPPARVTLHTFFFCYFLIWRITSPISREKINGLQCKQCVLFAFMIYFAMVCFITRAKDDIDVAATV